MQWSFDASYYHCHVHSADSWWCDYKYSAYYGDAGEAGWQWQEAGDWPRAAAESEREELRGQEEDDEPPQMSNADDRWLLLVLLSAARSAVLTVIDDEGSNGETIELAVTDKTSRCCSGSKKWAHVLTLVEEKLNCARSSRARRALRDAWVFYKICSGTTNKADVLAHAFFDIGLHFTNNIRSQIAKSYSMLARKLPPRPEALEVEVARHRPHRSRKKRKNTEYVYYIPTDILASFESTSSPKLLDMESNISRQA